MLVHSGAVRNNGPYDWIWQFYDGIQDVVLMKIFCKFVPNQTINEVSIWLQTQMFALKSRSHISGTHDIWPVFERNSEIKQKQLVCFTWLLSRRNSFWTKCCNRIVPSVYFIVSCTYISSLLGWWIKLASTHTDRQHSWARAWVETSTFRMACLHKELNALGGGRNFIGEWEVIRNQLTV